MTSQGESRSVSSRSSFLGSDIARRSFIFNSSATKKPSTRAPFTARINVALNKQAMQQEQSTRREHHMLSEQTQHHHHLFWDIARCCIFATASSLSLLEATCCQARRGDFSRPTIYHHHPRKFKVITRSSGNSQRIMNHRERTSTASSNSSRRRGNNRLTALAFLLSSSSLLLATTTPTINAFVVLEATSSSSAFVIQSPAQNLDTRRSHRYASRNHMSDDSPSSAASDWKPQWTNWASRVAATSLLASSILLLSPFHAIAENELSAKYGGGLDTSLVDQTCLVDQCSVQAKSCLADDPNCRKGLTCTAKCLGDNACITGCMARYGNTHLDDLLKCTIEDHECIKIAILPGGADPLGQEPKSPAPTVRNFDPNSLQGSWYKVVGYNPNYDCYACQRNTFSEPSSAGKTNNKDKMLTMDVEFSMPHLLPDGSPPPPTNVRELIQMDEHDHSLKGSQSIGLNDYHTRETMVFDTTPSTTNPFQKLVLHQGTDQEVSYARTAHSEGEMFGLKFWENWYILGENDPGTPEFKFIYYNGKTRQNTYEGAFVYSRSKELSQESMKKVYEIADRAGMNPTQFCRIRNGCFADETIVPERESGLGSPSNPFRGILASTKVSEFFGVEPVAARDTIRRAVPPNPALTPNSNDNAAASTSLKSSSSNNQRAWWYEVGDYLENPHRHFQLMDELRISMEWPEDVVVRK